MYLSSSSITHIRVNYLYVKDISAFNSHTIYGIIIYEYKFIFNNNIVYNLEEYNKFINFHVVRFSKLNR